jgi:hypothetical protein
VSLWERWESIAAPLAGVLAVFGFMCLADVVLKRRGARRAREDDVPEVLVLNHYNDRFSRRAFACVLLFLVILLGLGGAGHGFGWWPSGIFLSWQHGASDWIVTAELLAVACAALAALAFFPDTEWAERFQQWRLGRRDDETASRMRLGSLLAEAGLEGHPAVRLLRRKGAMNLLSSMELYRMMVDEDSRPLSLSRKAARRMVTKARDFSAGPRIPTVTGRRNSWEDTVRHEAGHAVARAALGSDSYWLEIDGLNRERTHAGRVLSRDFEGDGFSVDLWARQQWVDTVCRLAGEIAERSTDPSHICTGSLSDWTKSLKGPYLLSTRKAYLDGEPLSDVLGWLQAAHQEASQIIDENTSAIIRIIDRAKKVRSDDGRVFLGMVELRNLLDSVPQRDPERVTGSKPLNDYRKGLRPTRTSASGPGFSGEAF